MAPKQGRYSRDMPLTLPAPDDPRDATLQIAHKGLGAMVGRGIEDLASGWRPDHEPRRHERHAFAILSHALEEMAAVFHALKSLEHTITYGGMASDALRTLCDMFGRQLAIWYAESPADVLAKDVAEGLRQELLALDASREAGIELDLERETLERVKAELGGPAKPIAVANELRNRLEWEVLCVFRWESSHVHFGHAAVAATGRSIKTADGGMADVVMYPMSVWRAGQIIWATYGIGLRLLTFVAHHLSIPLEGVRAFDAELRKAIRGGAMRDKRTDEAASPWYGGFAFSIE